VRRNAKGTILFPRAALEGGEDISFCGDHPFGQGCPAKEQRPCQKFGIVDPKEFAYVVSKMSSSVYMMSSFRNSSIHLFFVSATPGAGIAFNEVH